MLSQNALTLRIERAGNTFIVVPMVIFSYPSNELLVDPRQKTDGGISKTVSQCLRHRRLLFEVPRRFLVIPRNSALLFFVIGGEAKYGGVKEGPRCALESW